VAATNRDLGELIEHGAFGRDLYERLATVRIAPPPGGTVRAMMKRHGLS
jgi:DNA-binding NtrC family response regulator